MIQIAAGGASTNLPTELRFKPDDLVAGEQRLRNRVHARLEISKASLAHPHSFTTAKIF